MSGASLLLLDHGKDRPQARHLSLSKLGKDCSILGSYGHGVSAEAGAEIKDVSSSCPTCVCEGPRGALFVGVLPRSGAVLGR